VASDESNPYDYLVLSDARSFDSAERFAGLLHSIHHALVDDGEISFVAVNRRPMIVFADRNELGNVELRSDVERQIAERRGYETKIEIIDGVAAFIDRRARFEVDRKAKSALFQSYRSGEIDQTEYRARYDALFGKEDAPTVRPLANTASPK
jgi:lysyl-tRNA synthetase class I